MRVTSARMPEHRHRLPRRICYCSPPGWTTLVSRLRGKHHYSGYGHWLEKELNAAGVITERCALARGNVPSWMQQAQDRASWRRVNISNRMRYSSSNKVSSTSRGSGNDAIAVIAPSTESTAVCTRVLRSHGRRDNIT